VYSTCGIIVLVTFILESCLALILVIQIVKPIKRYFGRFSDGKKGNIAATILSVLSTSMGKTELFLFCCCESQTNILGIIATIFLVPKQPIALKSCFNQYSFENIDCHEGLILSIHLYFFFFDLIKHVRHSKDQIVTVLHGDHVKVGGCVVLQLYSACVPYS
jgi:predicted short-subunit dehydrogenase-like oxidoreductase (DUF2520 family)